MVFLLTYSLNSNFDNDICKFDNLDRGGGKRGIERLRQLEGGW